MSGINLDPYGRQARLAPALLTLFPIFISIAVWTPDLYKLGTGLVGIALACGVTTAFAHFARSRGWAVQSKLVEQWGALPTTLWLRRSNNILDNATKQRYFLFLEQNVPDWRAPTVQEERANSEQADQIYGSAVRWLLEYTRDTKKYPLIFKENISYGFRRNALGLKSFAIVLTLVALGFGTFKFYGIPNSENLDEILPQIVAFVISIILLFWWVFIVTGAWVRAGADAYARALLAVCDTTSNPANPEIQAKK